jgi:hypothetical protein
VGPGNNMYGVYGSFQNIVPKGRLRALRSVARRPRAPALISTGVSKRPRQTHVAFDERTGDKREYSVLEQLADSGRALLRMSAEFMN